MVKIKDKQSNYIIQSLTELGKRQCAYCFTSCIKLKQKFRQNNFQLKYMIFYYFCLYSDIFNTMIIKKLLNKTFLQRSHLTRLENHFSNHKFNYGQGGELTLNLTKRRYDIFIKTIWDDYSELDISGLTGPSSFNIYSDQKLANFRDDELQINHSQEIKVSLSVPQDYTINGVVNGHITHQQSDVGKKMRSNPFKLEVTGPHNLTLGDITTQNISIINKEGQCSISSLTVETGLIESHKFSSKKLMTSSEISINSKFIQIRSLIAFGKSRAKLNCQSLDIQSISGSTEIIGEAIKIKRYYGGQNDINIKCRTISQVLGIETGTGKIIFNSAQQATAALPLIKLGFMHKGSLNKEGNIISIL